jgi:sugar phosphate isomerase/epimerase
MTTVKGPGIFLAQFLGDQPPFNTLEGICKWAAGLGFKGVQIPSWDPRCIDLQKAAESKTYADEIKGIVQATKVCSEGFSKFRIECTRHI